MKTLRILLLLPLVFSAYATFANAHSRTDRLYRPCSASSANAAIEVERDSDVNITQCSRPALLVKGTSIQSTVETVVTTEAELSAAIAAAGPPNLNINFSVFLNGDINITAPRTIPKNIIIYPVNNGKFVRLNAGVLTILGAIMAPRVKIFSGFDNTNLFINGATDAIYPEWFGAVGDNRTDDSIPIQLMFDVYKQKSLSGEFNASGKFLFGIKSYYSSKEFRIRRPSIIEGLGGTEKSPSFIRFAPNTKGFVFEGLTTEREVRDANITAGSNILTGSDFNFTSADVGRNVLIIGEGRYPYPQQIQQINSPTEAIVTPNAQNTVIKRSAYFIAESTSAGSKLSAIGLYGSDGATTHTITIDGKKITRTAGAAIDPYRNYGHGTTFSWDGIEWQMTTGVVPNIVGSFSGAGRNTFTPQSGMVDSSYLDAYVLINEELDYTITAVNTTANTYQISRAVPTALMGVNISITAYPNLLKGYRFVTIVSGKVVSKIANPVFSSALVGATIHIKGRDYKIATFTNGNAVTITNMDNSAVSFPHTVADAEITALALKVNRRVRFNNFHAIEVKAQVEIDNVFIGPRHGGRFAGNGISTPGQGGTWDEPNINRSKFSRNTILSVRGHGIYMRGTNGNRSEFSNNFIYNSRGVGIHDMSQHGNIYIGNESSDNEQGSHYFEGGLAHGSVLTGDYSEAGQPSIIMNSQTLWIGGFPGNRFSDEFNSGGILEGTGSTGKGMVANSIRTLGSRPSDSQAYGYANSYTTTQIGQGNFVTQPILMGFGNSNEIGTGNEPYPSISYALTYSQEGYPAPYWYGMQHGFFNVRNESGATKTAFAFSGGLAAEGPGQFWTPNGFFIGMGEDRRKVLATTIALKTNDINSPAGAAYTLVVSDLGKEVRLTNAAAKRVTLPPTASLTSGTGDNQIDGLKFVATIFNQGAGLLIFAAGAGVTIRNNTGTLAQYKTVTIRVIGTNEYVISDAQ